MKSLRCLFDHHDWDIQGYQPGWAFVFNVRCKRCGFRIGDYVRPFRPQIETTGKVLR